MLLFFVNIFVNPNRKVLIGFCWFIFAHGSTWWLASLFCCCMCRDTKTLMFPTKETLQPHPRKNIWLICNYDLDAIVYIHFSFLLDSVTPRVLFFWSNTAKPGRLWMTAGWKQPLCPHCMHWLEICREVSQYAVLTCTLPLGYFLLQKLWVIPIPLPWNFLKNYYTAIYISFFPVSYNMSSQYYIPPTKKQRGCLIWGVFLLHLAPNLHCVWSIQLAFVG